MKYQSIPDFSKLEVEGIMTRDDPGELAVAVLSTSLHADDLKWAEGVCVQLAQHHDPNVRGNAILGFGHMARIYGELTEPVVRPLIEAALHDPDGYVRQHADSAVDDVEHFLKWKCDRTPPAS